MSQVITIPKNFTFVGATGQGWSTDWIGIPPCQNWQLVVEAKSMLAGTNLGYALNVTFDTDTAIAVASSAGAIAAVGTTTFMIVGGDMGPMVRFTFNAVAASSVVLSVYLTPIPN